MPAICKVGLRGTADGLGQRGAAMANNYEKFEQQKFSRTDKNFSTVNSILNPGVILPLATFSHFHRAPV